jgi:hypothetical protein
VVAVAVADLQLGHLAVILEVQVVVAEEVVLLQEQAEQEPQVKETMVATEAQAEVNLAVVVVVQVP